MTALGDRLRMWLEFRGISLRTFSDETGVPYATLQNYLSGKRSPGADHLARIGAGGIDLNWLLRKVRDTTTFAEVAEADVSFRRALAEQALRLVDVAQQIRVEKGFKPLGAVGCVLFAERLVWYGIRNLRRFADKIAGMRAAGLDTPAIASIAMGSVGDHVSEEAIKEVAVAPVVFRAVEEALLADVLTGSAAARKSILIPSLPLVRSPTASKRTAKSAKDRRASARTK